MAARSLWREKDLRKVVVVEAVAEEQVVTNGVQGVSRVLQMAEVVEVGAVRPMAMDPDMEGAHPQADEGEGVRVMAPQAPLAEELEGQQAQATESIHWHHST